MICPHCNADSLRVIDSRDVEAEPAIRRRRECDACGFRFTTYERVEAPHLWIVKKDGRREQFDRAKLARGLWRATEKRPVSEAKIEQVISRIEQDIRATGDAEVPSTLVGETVMEYLKELDHIAYIRFASVYREFSDLGELKKEVNALSDAKAERASGKPEKKVKQVTG